MHAVIKREACVSIRFTALDIEISTKFNYFKWKIHLHRLYYILYKYNENDPYIFFWLEIMIYKHLIFFSEF